MGRHSPREDEINLFGQQLNTSLLSQAKAVVRIELGLGTASGALDLLLFTVTRPVVLS
jgi:hypothetical protein